MSGRRPLSGTDAKRLHREWRRRTERPVSLLLDHVQNPFNVGSIVRTAASFRVEHLHVVGAAAVTPDHPKAKKTSLGTERLLPWSEHASVADAAEAASGLLVGVELASGASPLHELDLGAGPLCLVVGNEDRGLSPAALDVCDRVAFVPTPGKVGSLNVAVACAIALYEARRQEWAPPTGG